MAGVARLFADLHAPRDETVTLVRQGYPEWSASCGVKGD
jgi:hypothetical protein